MLSFVFQPQFTQFYVSLHTEEFWALWGIVANAPLNAVRFWMLSFSRLLDKTQHTIRTLSNCDLAIDVASFSLDGQLKLYVKL